MTNQRSDKAPKPGVAGGTSKKPLQAQPPKRASSRYGGLGDVVCIPIKRNMCLYIQIVEMTGKQTGVVAPYRLVSDVCQIFPDVQPDLVERSVEVELTGIAWDHWRVVANKPPVKVDRPPSLGVLPCFVAEVELVNMLKEIRVIKSDFRLYRDIRASHPKLQSDHRASLSTVMSFLSEHGVLTAEGIAEIADGMVSDDFSMTSDLLTVRGAEFYDRLFKKDFVRGFLSSDTLARITTEWAEFCSAK